MAENVAPITVRYHGCFGCGIDNPVGLRLQFAKQDDRVVSETTLAQEYAGYREFAHGGIVATLLDEAMGYAVLHIAGRYAVTRGLNVSYRRPIHVGRPITLAARLLDVSGTRIRLEATIHDARGRLLATADGDWVTVRDERGEKQVARK